MKNRYEVRVSGDKIEVKDLVMGDTYHGTIKDGKVTAKTAVSLAIIRKAMAQ